MSILARNQMVLLGVGRQEGGAVITHMRHADQEISEINKIGAAVYSAPLVIRIRSLPRAQRVDADALVRPGAKAGCDITLQDDMAWAQMLRG